MEVKKVGLLGGRGYVGQEVVQLLAQHKYLNISSVFSLTKAGQPLDLNAGSDLIYQDLSIENIVLADEDAYILALPNNESHKYVDLIFQHNSKAIIVDIRIVIPGASKTNLPFNPMIVSLEKTERPIP
jgi:N-acetyl-gamma-glutamylphosphate reductase